MAYLSIENFSAGMDRRRKRVAGAPGSLWTLKDAHITRGGDIERRKKFVTAYALPSGSRYLAAVRSQLYTFGSADLAATTPIGVTYQRLQTTHAQSILTIASGQNAADAETLVIGSKTYTFQTTLTNVDGNIKIGADRIATLRNLARAINAAGGTPGTDYAALNTVHPTVYAIDNGDGTMTAVARSAGTGGNSIVVTEAMAQGSWNPNANMAGGTTAVLTRVLDAKPFQGLLYVIAEYDDGGIYHYYDGERVFDWDAAVTADALSVAERMAGRLNRVDAVTAQAVGAVVIVTAAVAGTAFTLTAGTTNGGVDATQSMVRAAVTANVAGVVETRASATVTITGGVSNPGTDVISSIKVNNVETLAEVVDWSGSNSATAIRVATQINNGTAVHGYSASVVGAVVTITAAPGTGTTPNGYAVAVTVGGTVTFTQSGAMAGGVAAVTAVAQVDKLTISGVIELKDTFTATLNSTDYKVTGLSSVMGTSLYVDKQRVWSPARSLWRYCMLGNARVWAKSNLTTDNDSGFINIAQETEGNDNLVVATRYQNLAAIISQSFITLYTLSTNPANIAISDTLDNTGTDAARSVVRFGNNDVFYLDSTGIRSLRARDASNAAFVSDVGNAVDPFITETLAALKKQQVLDAAGVIEPQDGRFWLAAGGYIFVLSFFPSDKISAWSYYQPAEFGANSVEVFVRANKKVYVRAGDTVFLYGGTSGTEYPGANQSPPTVELPFMAAGTPATFKEFHGFDIACTNTWEIEVLYDPNVEARTINIGTVVKTTFNELNLALSGTTTMVGLKLVCERAGAASISSMQLHYNKVPEK